MGLLDAILPKKYKNSRTLYEEDLDAWRQKTEDYLNTVNLNLQQLGIDAFGSDYEFNNDGHATEAITLEQYIYNIIDGTTPIDGTSSDTFIINSDGNASTLTTASMTAPRTHTLPDIAGTFMMLEGTQTASGVKTFNNIVPKVVGPAAGRATLVNANTATDRTLTIPDPGASSELVALAGNQTVTGVKTFSTPPAFTQATGTAPFSVSSTTLVNNLHAATADAATNATNAANIAIVDDTTTNATMYPTWVAATTGNNAAKVSSSKISFNPSTGVLSSTFSGNLTGNVTGNCSGSSGSCTGNAATATTTTNTINVREVDGSTYSQRPLAKAWASFHFSVITPGSVYGVVVDDSYGISGISVVDAGGLSAHLDITFTTSFNNTVYCVLGSSSILISAEATAYDKRQSWTWHPITRATSHCTISAIGHYSEWTAAGSHKAGTLPVVYTNDPFAAGTGDGCIVFFGV